MKIHAPATSALAGALAFMGALAIPSGAQAALQTLTVELNNYDFITPNGQDLAQFKAQDVATGGVNVTVTLNPTGLPNGPYYFASTGNHVTVAFNLDTTITAADITFGANAGNTFNFVTNQSPPREGWEPMTSASRAPILTEQTATSRGRSRSISTT